MESRCKNDNGNIYFQCRKRAAMHNEKLNSRESAAEMLGLSASTLSQYELGVTKVVPPDSVVMMADLYKAPELKAHYCKNECPIGHDAPIAENVYSVELATVKMIKAFCRHEAEEMKRKMVDLAADGQITPDELPDLIDVLAYLNSISKTVSELRLTCEKALANSEYAKK